MEMDFFFPGLLRLQELFQRIRPGSSSNSLLIEKVRRVDNYKEAIQFLTSLEMIDRLIWYWIQVTLNSLTKS